VSSLLSREYTGEGFRSECLFRYAEQLPLLLTYSTKPLRRAFYSLIINKVLLLGDLTKPFDK